MSNQCKRQRIPVQEHPRKIRRRAQPATCRRDRPARSDQASRLERSRAHLHRDPRAASRPVRLPRGDGTVLRRLSRHGVAHGGAGGDAAGRCDSRERQREGARRGDTVYHPVDRVAARASNRWARVGVPHCRPPLMWKDHRPQKRAQLVLGVIEVFRDLKGLCPVRADFGNVTSGVVTSASCRRRGEPR